jgi:RimJ/RimL family protein N-acetyltransferase
MDFELQPTTLQNALVKLNPIKKEDFEDLYKVASDPLIWEQHPNKNRFQRDIFEIYFTGAMESGGAFLVFDNTTGVLIGSSRFYEFNKEERSVAIGYTFLARDHWGSVYNTALKSIMIDHAFKFVNTVIFHIGSKNIRSQKAITKLGADKIGEVQMEYFGEQPQWNFIFQITKEEWQKLKLNLE